MASPLKPLIEVAAAPNRSAEQTGEQIPGSISARKAGEQKVAETSHRNPATQLAQSRSRFIDAQQDRKFVQDLRRAVSSPNIRALVPLLHPDPLGASLHLRLEEIEKRGIGGTPPEPEDIEDWLAALRSILTHPLHGAQKLKEQTSSGAGYAGLTAGPSRPQPTAQCSESIAGQLDEDAIIQKLIEALPLPRGHMDWSSRDLRSQIRDEAERLIISAVARVISDSDAAKRLHRMSLATDHSQVAAEHTVSSSTYVERLRSQPLSCGASQQRSNGDVLSRLATPTSAWKAKQKDPIQHRTRGRFPVKVAPQQSLIPVLDRAVTYSEERPGRQATHNNDARSMRSMSTGSIPSGAMSRQSAHRRGSASEEESRRALLDALRARPPPDLVRAMQNASPSSLWTVNDNGEQRPSRSHPLGRVLLDSSIPEIAPLQIKRKRTTATANGRPPIPQMSEARRRPTSSLFGTTTRPDPFAPKAEHSFVLNHRPAVESKLKLGSPNLASRRSMMFEPGVPATRPQTRIGMRSEHQDPRPLRMSKAVERPQTPAWERLAQQQTSAWAAKNKGRSGSDASQRSHRETPQREPSHRELGNMRPLSYPSIQMAPELSARIRDVGELHKTVEGHIPDSNPPPKEEEKADSDHVDPRKDSGPGRDSLGTNIAVSQKPATKHSNGLASHSIEAGILFGVSDEQLARKPVPSRPDDSQIGAEDREIDIRARKRLELDTAKELVMPDKVLRKSSKPSLLRQSFKGAISALRKSFGGVGNPFAGVKFNKRIRRRSLDSLMDEPRVPGGVGDVAFGERSTLTSMNGRFAFSARRTAQPLTPSKLATTIEEDEEAVAASQPTPPPQELPATDLDGNVKRSSGETIRAWNEGGAQWLKTASLQDPPRNSSQ